MTKLRSIVFGLLLTLAAPWGAFAQCSGQAPATTYCGNPTGALALPGWKPLSAIPFPNIAGGTVVGNRGTTSAAASALTNPILGIPGTSTGQMGFAGSGSGTATVSAQSAAGSATILLPTGAGTLASTASSPLILNATTGGLTCPTCVTTSGGGALTATAPITVSAGGLIAINAPYATLTASNGGIVYSDATNLVILPGTATARQMLQSGANSAPGWSPTTWPATTTINRILFSSAANVIGEVATANTAVLTTTSGGVPQLVTTLPCANHPALTGDITTSAGACATTLATVNANVGTFGSATQTTTFTVNAKGLITAASQQTATPAVGSITGLGTGVATALGVNTNATGGFMTLPATTRAGDLIYFNGTNWVILAGNNSGTKLLQEDASGVPTWITASGTGTVTSVTCGTGLTGGTFTTTGTCAIDKATSANLEAGTSNKVLTADIIYDAEVTITFAASQTLDFSTFLNARITATANTTSLTCSNIKASQSGVITWVQDGTGSRTMVAGWCSQFRWSNGTRGVLSTAINAVDALFYQCVSTSICYVSLGKAQAN